MRIILIEDSQTLRESLKELFELRGYEIMAFEDANPAINSMVIFKPDVILCDIMLPGEDGYKVLRKVRQNPELKNVVFIFITAKSEVEQIRIGMNSGADDYIVKPFLFDDLLNSIIVRIDRFIVLRSKKMQSQSDLKKTIEKMTKTELEVLKLIAKNYTSDEIAKLLFVSKRTIDKHRNNMHKKLNKDGGKKFSLVKLAIEYSDFIMNI